MRFDFRKMGTVCVACLLVCMTCIAVPLRTHASEENALPQSLSAKVYSSMSDDSDIIANLIVGNVFEVVGDGSDSDGGKWYKVRTDFGAEGYMKAEEFDRLNMVAQAMMSSTATAPADDAVVEQPAAEEPAEQPVAAEPAPEEVNASDSGASVEANQASANQVEVPDRQDGDQMEEGDASEDNNAGLEPEISGDIAPENSDVIQNPISDGESETDIIDGAGFGKMEDSITTESTAPDSEGFTVVQRTEESEMRRHGRIDAVLIMIIAGGIICIVAIAALTRKMWICIRTGA